MHELYELKEQLTDELLEYRSKPKKSVDDIMVIKYLASAIDHICNIIMNAEEEGHSERGNYSRDGYSREYSRNMGGNRNSYEGGQGGSRNSYARGRNARRDSMGRYSREGGYSRTDGMDSLVEEIRSMMQELPQNVQQDAQRFVQKLEQEM